MAKDLLERQGLADLLARAGVFDRGREHRLHRAHGLGAGGDGGTIEGAPRNRP